MRDIPDPGFAGDDGAADPAFAEALRVYREDPAGGYLPALAALCGARLLVPVVTQGDESTAVDMATVLMRRAGGDTALIAFSGLPTLTSWNAEARPIPAEASTAAIAAIQEGAIALLVDFDGPVQFAVEGEDLSNLARGWRLVAIDDIDHGGWGWATPAG